VGVELLAFYYEGDVRELFFVDELSDVLQELAFAVGVEIKLRARVRIQYVDVLEVILAIAASNNEEPAIHEGFGVACSGLGLVLAVLEVVYLVPFGLLRLEHKQIVEAVSMRPRPPKQKQHIVYVAETHASSGGRTLTLDQYLRPNQKIYIEDVEVVESFGAIPPSEDVEMFFNERGAMVGSRRRTNP